MLEVDSLSVRYRSGSTVLDSASLAVHEGELVSVLGSNGAGKSTLLRAIAGLLSSYDGTVTRGRIRWQGADLAKVGPVGRVKAGIAMTPEGRGIFANLTVEENLRAGAFTVPRRERNARVDESLQLFPDLTGRRNERAGLLSGGQQQMLALARALISRPRLLLLDEPSLGLAPIMVRRVAEVVVRVNQEGTSVLLIEQNAAVALELAQRSYVLELGRVTASGPSDELRASDRIRALYLGMGDELPVPPAANGAV